MYRIVEKQDLAPALKLMVVEAPHVARKARAGQFVIVRIDETGERIPLTIADSDPPGGRSPSSSRRSARPPCRWAPWRWATSFATVVGPLGQPTEIENYGTVVCVGGGIGIAPVYPIARALKEAGNRVISIIGARTQDLLILGGPDARASPTS